MVVAAAMMAAGNISWIQSCVPAVTVDKDPIADTAGKKERPPAI